MVSKKKNHIRECSRYDTTRTDLFMYQVVPKYVLVSICRRDLLVSDKKAEIVHVHSIADTGFAFWIIINYIEDLGFFDLHSSPIRKMRLRIPLPATIASFRAMVRALG